MGDYLMIIGSVRRESNVMKKSNLEESNQSTCSEVKTFNKKIFVLQLDGMEWIQTDIELELDQNLKHGQALIMPNNAVHIIADGRRNLPCWETTESADGMIHYGFNF